MLPENQNDKLKHKLDALTEVPEGFHFNSSAVWAKLETQLQSNGKRKKRFVFLYAAASVLFVVIALLVYRNFSKHETIIPAVTSHKNSASGTSLVKLKDKMPSPVSKNIANKEIIKIKSSSESRQQVILATPEMPGKVVENDSQIGVIPAEVIDKPGEPPIVIVTPAPKTRFKIAHINEVNLNSIPADIVKQEPKYNYGFSLRKDALVAGEDDKEKSPGTYSLRKSKSFFSLINSQ